MNLERLEEFIEMERRRRNSSASRNEERDFQRDKDRAGGTWPDDLDSLTSNRDPDRERVPNRDYYDGVGR